MKKLLLGIGTLATIIAPITLVIACGSNDETDKDINQSNIYPSFDNRPYQSILYPSTDIRPKQTNINRYNIISKDFSDYAISEIIENFDFVDVTNDDSKKVELEAEYRKAVIDEYTSEEEKIKINNMKIDDLAKINHMFSPDRDKLYFSRGLLKRKMAVIMVVNQKTNHISLWNGTVTSYNGIGNEDEAENFQNAFKNETLKGVQFENFENIVNNLGFIDALGNPTWPNIGINQVLRALVPIRSITSVGSFSDWAATATKESYNKEKSLVKDGLELLDYQKSLGDTSGMSHTDARAIALEYGTHAWMHGGYELFTRAKFLPDKLEYDTSIYSPSETENLRYINELNDKIHSFFADKEDFLKQFFALVGESK